MCFGCAVSLTSVWFRQESCIAFSSPPIKFHSLRRLSTGRETDFTMTMNIVFMMRNDIIQLLLSIQCPKGLWTLVSPSNYLFHLYAFLFISFLSRLLCHKPSLYFMQYIYNIYNHRLPRIKPYITRCVFVKVQMLKAYASILGGCGCSHKLPALGCTTSCTFSCPSYLWLVQRNFTSTICLVSQLKSWDYFN